MSTMLLCLLFLHASFLLVAAAPKHLSEEFLADMLVPTNETKHSESEIVEGSGDDSFRKIPPIPTDLSIYMDRLQAPPASEADRSKELVETSIDHLDHIETLADDGSGASELEIETPKTAAIVTPLDDLFITQEEGMEDVYKELARGETSESEKDDQNEHDNALSVLVSNEDLPVEPDMEIAKSADLNVEVEEGSGGSITPVITINSEENRKTTTEDFPIVSTDPPSTETATEEREIEELHKEVSEVVENADTSDEYLIPTTSEESVTEETELVAESVDDLNRIGKLLVTNSTDSEETVPTTVDSESAESTTQSSAVSIEEESTGTPSTEEPSTEEQIVETTVPVETSTGSVIVDSFPTTEEAEISTETVIVQSTETVTTESPTEAVVIETTQPISETSSTSREMPSSTPEETLVDTTTEYLSTIAPLESLPIVPVVAIREDHHVGSENISNDLRESEATHQEVKVLAENDADVAIAGGDKNQLAIYVLLGFTVISMIVFIIFLVMRRKTRHGNVDLESSQDKDTDKTVLNLGKYKDDSDDNNVKNNEIAPLVLKQNTQINKFEKNQHFSSPKNLNTTANEKNVEKDNVLKSTQAIIDEEDVDAKKAASEEKDVKAEDEKKALLSDNVPATEKLIVHTRMDQDSIPRKPIIVTRNGNGYLPVSQDPV